MRAVQLRRPGHPLEDVEVPDPVPAEGEVVVAVAAAGICHSDVHYRSGTPAPRRLPVVPGHEIAGVIAAAGPGVAMAPGTRVAVHYQIGCGECDHCRAGFEQFCPDGEMVGNHRDGGYAELVRVPGRNVVAVPDGVRDEHAAAIMCSSATSLHALRKGRLAPGETVAVFGCGGLGLSAIQLARNLGAAKVIGVDPNPDKRALAESFGAVTVDPIDGTAAEVRRISGGRGVDVALELVGSGAVMSTAIDSLAPMGRAVAVGLTQDRIEIGPYTDLVFGERELIGCSDHLRSELVELLQMAEAGTLDLGPVVTACVRLDAGAINHVFDQLEHFGGSVRTVIVP